jgi:hypothetical protein
MAVYSFVPTEGAYGHGIATIDNDKGIQTFEYTELGEYNGKQYIYTSADSDHIPTQPDDINFKKVSKCPNVFLDEWRSKRKAELDSITENLSQYKCKDMYLTSSLGFKIDADIKAQTNLKGLIRIGRPVDKFKDYDNQYQAVSVEGLNTMLTECSINGANLYATRFIYCDALEASSSIDEIMEMTFDFPMSDFSKAEV